MIMNTAAEAPFWLQPIGWALIHFVWQGALIGTATGCAILLMRKSSAQARYGVLCGALFLCAISPPITWAILESNERILVAALPLDRDAPPSIPALPTPPRSAPIWPTDEAALGSTPNSSGGWERWSGGLENAAPWCVAFWAAGVLILSARLAWDFCKLRHICSLGRSVAGEWPTQLDRLASQLGVRKTLTLLESAHLDVPTVIGALRPVLLVPGAFLTNLPPDQIKAIFAHELAHIRRHDYLINLFQVALETLLFYHPAVWWISRAIRRERENCCDDLALSVVGDSGTYAKALAALEESRSLPMAITMAASGGSLLHRIRRLAGLRETAPASHAWLTVMGLLISGVLAFTVMRAEEAHIAAESDPLAGIDLTKQEFDRRGFYDSAYRDAVMNDQLDKVAAFLRHGQTVNPNVLLRGGDDILAVAAWFAEDPRMVSLLLAHGAKPIGGPDTDGSAVNLALVKGDKEIADMLIAAGGAVDPLLYDAGLGLVEDLKKRDAVQPFKEPALRHALDVSIKAGQLPTFDWLWAKIRKGKEPDDTQKLHDMYGLAAQSGRLPLMLHLEQLGVKVNDVGSKALELAIAGNHLPEAQHLFDAGAKLVEDPKYFRSLLGEAAGDGHLEMARLLLDHGANINARDKEGQTPLMWGAYMGHDDFCHMLVERGADLTIQDKYGHTALWEVAVGTYCPKTLQLMIEKGIRVEPTAFDKMGHSFMVSILCTVAPQPGEPGFPGTLMSPAEYRDYEKRERRTMDLLVQAGLNPSGQAGTETPLMTAIDLNHFPAADEFLNLGADPQVKDKDNGTALNYLISHWETRTFPIDLLKHLLKSGVNPNGESFFPGMTPLTKVYPLTSLLSDSRGMHPESLTSLRAAVAQLINSGARFPGMKSASDQDFLLGAALDDLPKMKAALASGSSVNVQSGNDSNWNALMIAICLGYLDEAHWLLDNGWLDPLVGRESESG
jgi:ankyrin repeat protein/beta-lactamase regulating signal transducer with metallopeptidase domain